MSTKLDIANPAVVAHVDKDPAFLDKVEADSTALAPWARVMLAMHLDRMNQRVYSGEATVAQAQSFLELLAKIGDATPKASQGPANGQGSGGFSVNIILGGAKTTPPVVIDAKTGTPDE